MCYLLLVPWVCVCDVPFFGGGVGRYGEGLYVRRAFYFFA